MENEPNSAITREEYEAPQVEDIPLRSGETLLAGCKTANAGPGSAAFNHSCGPCHGSGAS